jgi:PAS domain S-box-containing protein
MAPAGGRTVMTPENTTPRTRLTQADAVIAVLEGDIDELCRLVAERVFGLNPEAYVIVTVYDPAIDAIRVQQLLGFGDQLDEITRVIGVHPRSMQFSRSDMTAEEKRLYTSGRLEHIPGGLKTMLAATAPATAIEAIESILQARSVYSVGFALESEPYGGVVVVQKTEAPPASPSAIETLANHVSMAIHRQHALADLGRSEARYRWLAESVSDLIWTVDRSGVVELANGAAWTFLDVEPHRLVGRSILGFLTDQSARLLEEYLHTSADAAEGRLLELEYVRADGSLLPAEVRVGRMPATEPQARFIGVSRDLTERRRLEQEQRALEERRHRAESLESIGRLAGGVAHDLNNRLVPILGHAELLLSERGDDATSEHRASLQAIMEAAESARSLVRQLLAFGRRQPLMLDRVRLDEVIREVGPLLRRTVPESIRLELRLRDGLPPVRADRSELQRVVINLVANARDAIDSHGAVTVETSSTSWPEPVVIRGEEMPPGEYVILRIEDDGRGMTDGEQAQIFEPFFTTRSEAGGTGLGLATVHGIVRQHGGGIRVQSTPGRGSAFEVFLPVDHTADEPAVREPATETERLEGNETVLLVEDDENVRIFVARALARFGYRVLETGDVHDALRKARDYDGDIDLLLTDVVMPSLDGRELLGLVAEARPSIRTLLMSGYAHAEVGASGEHDRVELIRKPFTARELVRFVRRMLDEPRE